MNAEIDALIREVAIRPKHPLSVCVDLLCEEVARLVKERTELRTNLREASFIALALFDRCYCGQIALWLCWTMPGEVMYRCDAHKVDSPYAKATPMPTASNVAKIRAFIASAEVEGDTSKESTQ